ncbi:MAG: helix-turn-helix domain-containing protein [Bdellovibrio sp.]
MKKTGEILKKAREEKGLSLQEIGLSLKINSKILKAIEDGEDPNLPAKTFLRGFVLSYANFLHLNSDDVLKVFYEEVGSTKPRPYLRLVEEDSATVTMAAGETASGESSGEVPVAQVQKKPAKEKNDDLKSLHQKKNTKTVVFTILGFALVGLIVFTKKMIDKYSKEAEVPTAAVEQTIKGVTPVVPESTSVQLNGNAADPADALSHLTNGLENSNGAAVPAATSETKDASAAAATSAIPDKKSELIPKTSSSAATTALAATTTSATNPSSSTAATAPTANSQKPATPTAATAATTAEAAAKPAVKPEEKNKPVELIVEALDSVEIEYSAPNGKPQKIKLAAEQVHTFKSNSGLKINFSNGGAVNLIHNGKEIGIPGDLGKPVKLSY